MAAASAVRRADPQDDVMLTLAVRVAGGEVQHVPAIPGMTLMELLRANDIPIVAECGGAAVCASCHVRIAADWIDRLDPPATEERDRLDDIPAAGDNSRLACQIRMTDELDGLAFELQPDSVKALSAGGHR